MLSGVDGRVLEVTAAAEPGLPGFEQRGTHGWGLDQCAERASSAVTASATGVRPDRCFFAHSNTSGVEKIWEPYWEPTPAVSRLRQATVSSHPCS
jgi:hypothetical protein